MSPVESANLLLKLYELRRESVMREARNTVFMKFNPQSADEYMAAIAGPIAPHPDGCFVLGDGLQLRSEWRDKIERIFAEANSGAQSSAR